MNTQTLPDLNKQQSPRKYFDPEIAELRFKLRDELYALNRLRREFHAPLSSSKLDEAADMTRDLRTSLPFDRIELMTALVTVSNARAALAAAKVRQHVFTLTEELKRPPHKA